MDTFFLVILGFLALLAAIDLFVGVSNDASNFLNSAVGCRIAPYKVLVAVAGLGILLGATFSGGMMEIAKKGVFNPGMFSFSDVMAIYFSVMVTDVVLLNFFNSMGLPTSTTVSIVFELLGAAVGVEVNRILERGGSLVEVGAYINNEKALTMISAILVSVVVAFIAGAIVQYILRVIFSFHYEKMYRRIGGIYGGFAVTMIFYFLVMKGASGASFMTPEMMQFLDTNTWPILGVLFIGSTVLMQLGLILFNLNIFKIVILAGTFALAFAFAGNDLVNFVGVPIAALDSYHIFTAAQGADPNTFAMGGLADPIPAPTLLLILSGIIMVLTIRFSKSAQRVIETSVNLSSSTTGEKEQFGASMPGRIIVRSAMSVENVISKLTPSPVKKWIDTRFEPIIPPTGTEPLPFDYVRASINLILTAILISSATSLQLPLSTTYVTFMVGMGSSFADRAWDRETAVYRVSGVLIVIVGWFLTALTAFVAAGAVATVVLWGSKGACIILMLIAVAVIVKENFFASDEKQAATETLQSLDRFGVRKLLNKAVAKNFETSVTIFRDMIRCFLDDNERGLREVSNRAGEFFDNVSEGRARYYQMAQRQGSHSDNDAKFFYYRSYSNMREVCRTLKRTAIQAQEHVANRHRVFKGEIAGSLEQLVQVLEVFEQDIRDFSGGWSDTTELRERSKKVSDLMDQYQELLLSDIHHYDLSLRGCELYMIFLQFARDLLNRYDMVVILQNHLNDMCENEKPFSIPAEGTEPPASGTEGSEPSEQAEKPAGGAAA